MAFGNQSDRVVEEEDDDEAPDWLIPHFKATVVLLSGYRPNPLKGTKTVVNRGEEGFNDAQAVGPAPSMKTAIYWARSSTFDGTRFPEMPPRSPSSQNRSQRRSSASVENSKTERPRSDDADVVVDQDSDNEDEDDDGMKFLTEPRTDFSAGPWADLLHGQDIRIEVAPPGQDHFSIMVSNFLSFSLFSSLRPCCVIGGR